MRFSNWRVNSSQHDKTIQGTCCKKKCAGALTPGEVDIVKTFGG